VELLKALSSFEQVACDNDVKRIKKVFEIYIIKEGHRNSL
jgi:hypothetical protein